MVVYEVPAHLSHSQASSLLGEGCPAAYWFERVLGKPAVPGWAQLGGSALHVASEDWDHLTLRGEVETDPEALHQMFGRRFDDQIGEKEQHSPFPREEWQASGRQGPKITATGGPNRKDEAWWRTYGPQMLAAYASWRLTTPWEIAQITDPATGEPVWGVEIGFEVEMGGVPVRGYIDRVFQRAIDGVIEYLVVDLKSGREPETSGQLGTYRQGLVKQYGIDPLYGSYWLGGSGTATAFVDLRAKWPAARVEKRFATARRRQLAGEFDCAGCFICRSGGVREYVANSGGSKAAETPQPWSDIEIAVKPPRV